MSFSPTTACRSCGASDLFPVIDLGEQPLANAFRPPSETSPLPRYPLGVLACGSCSLVQLTGSVPPSEMFDTYHYFSSYSTTMVERMAQLARRMTTDLSLGADSLVVEVASNDGYLLRHYVDRDVPVLGIDPARNVAAVAEANGVPTLVDYFGTAVAGQLQAEGRLADVVHANNVMAHVPDINDFVAGLAVVLAPGGVAVIESPYVVRLVESTEFDTIYHEHVFYYSLTAVSTLFERHGLVVADVEQLDIHGGSLRYFVRHAGAEVTERAAELARIEAKLGVGSPDFYEPFAAQVEALKVATVDLLDRRHRSGRTIAGYGAAAKGTVLLNHFGIGDDLLSFVVDRNTHKHGLVVPGTGLPIRPTAALLDDQPDDVLLLAWNFAPEILGQQAGYRAAGGTFIIPIPALEVVS
jgi:SAM-dependent methyltransferase